MVEALLLWRSPIDKTAVCLAQELCSRQPRCSIPAYEDFSAMTIYNFGYYIQNDGPTADTALPAMLTAMNPSSLGASGAVAFIPQTNYPVDTSSGPFKVPDQSNIIASGGGGSNSSSVFFHFDIHGTLAASTFLDCSGSAYTTGGTYFHGLAFRWDGSTNAGDTCVYAGTPNCGAIRCTFNNCPRVMEMNASSCALEQCTIDYGHGSPDDATAIAIANSQCAVLGPGEFFQDQPSSGGPQGCTCILIQGGAEHAVIADLHISDWTTGLDFSQGGGSKYTHVRNCEIQSYITALKIQVYTDGAPISGIKVTSSTLARTNDSPESMNASPVVLIDPGGSDNSKLSDITLLGCSVFNMGNASTSYLTGQHGLKIVGGTNIKVIGGTYSNNAPHPYGGAGIAITGACGDVQIIGANLQPSYDNGTGGSTTQNQQFGLLVTANPTGVVLVSGCDIRGYSSLSSAVSISGVTSNLFIYDCLGYNDQNTELNGNVAPTSSSNSAATCGTPYFGPSIITFYNASPVTLHIFGQSMTLSFGVVFVPSPYDIFYFGATTPTGFSWYGK